MIVKTLGSPIVLYGLSIVITRGLSLISIPLLTSHLHPQAFGEFDLAISLIEFAGLFCALGLADTLYRFAPKKNQCKKKLEIAKINATALIGALTFAVLSLFWVPLAHQALHLKIPLLVLHAGIIAACLTGLIELPLAWLRLNNHPLYYLSFVSARTLIQLSVMAAVLFLGHGASAIIIANAGIDIILALIIFSSSCITNGFKFYATAFKRLINYGFPLVGASLSMFALGAADRWFLAQSVTRIDLAHYALAMKLSLATALIIQPLFLWWFPQRLSVLQSRNGIERNSEIWRFGLVVLALGAALIGLTMPLFIWILLPPSYAIAVYWLPPLILISTLNELVSLSNAGAYLQTQSWRIFMINFIAALVAILLYFILIPSFGVSGAISATIIAHLFRLIGFLHLSLALAPVPFFAPIAWLPVVLILCPMAFVWPSQNLIYFASAALITPLIALACAHYFGLITSLRLSMNFKHA